MLPAHFVLCLLSCIAFSGAVYEDCKTPPPVDHARAELFESEHVNTAIYSCASGYVLKGKNELVCNVDTEEWQGEPPVCLKNKAIHQSERKKKMLAIPEELNVAVELAQQLDLSCIQAKVQAPEINHGIIAKYERRRRGDKVFLVAYYDCNENYDFERRQANALYCSNKQWVGELPTCLPRLEYPDPDDDDDDDDDYDEYETIDNDVVEDMDSESQLGEHVDSLAPPPPPPPVEENEKEQVEQVEQLEPKIVPVEQQLEAAPEPNVDVVSIAEPEPQLKTEPELNNPEAEPEIVVHVNEPEPELEPAAELAPKETPATDISIVVPPTKDPYSPRLLDEDCGADRGGCDHKCVRLLFPGENEPRFECSCNEGYTLDPQDYARCHDIDECQESNGHCSQICNNLPGSFECGCEKGYQIDAATGNTCVDIDECADPELSPECSNGCENTPGSYRCVMPLNTKAEAGQDSNETDQDNEIELKPVAQPEVPEVTPIEKDVEPVVEPIDVQLRCNAGFALSPDGSECQDINECDIVVEESENSDHVPHRVCQQECKNTIGSYRCSCHEGFHLLEDGSSCASDTCEDLDNPQLNRTRCAHQCQNLASGGYECICPDGYKLGQDLHSCEVLETVCSRELGHERCRPGTCVANEDNSTFSCLCPKGYTSEVFSCQDVDECAMGTHKCSHDCFNTAGSYQCLCPRGMALQEPEGHTCVAPDPCAVNNNGCEQLCLSANGGSCTCSKGYVLSTDGKSCSDVDECEVKNGGCQQLCRNLPGSYECLCAPGYELLDLDGLVGYCFDIDECATNVHSCDASMRCENLNGSYTCLCEQGYAQGISSSSPSQSSSSSLLTPSLSCLDIDECSLSNANCSHFCLNQPGSFQCACADGFQLAADGFTCLDIDECARDFGNCSSICINLLGSHSCACDRGYELTADGHSCQDVDECAGLLSGGCTHECINKPGSYECGCPLGYVLQEDERSCRPALVGCPPGTRHTEQGCEPIECELGMLLGADGSCVDIDECKVNNGGCSHQCRNSQGSFKCECPAGYTLSENLRDCRDIDECEEKNGGCEERCINVPGSFNCECAEGKRLSFDERSCYTVPKIEPRVSVGRPVPVTPIAPATPVMPVRPMPTLRPVSYPSLPTSTVTTFEVRDQCVRFQAPANGQAHCNRYRHKRKLFYNTRCKVRCNAGYQLLGSEIRSCGASGNWEGQDNQCVPISQPRLWNVGTSRSVPASSACPALPTPRNGVISPASCTRGASSFGSVCHLQCNMGFVPVAGMLTSCMNGWTLGSALECKPFASNIFGNQMSPRVQSPWQMLQQQHPFRQRSSSSIQQVRRQHLPIQTHTPTAYIKCPENVVILLNPHQTKAHVILQRPATNVDYRHVVAFPAWAKQLQGHLPAGTHKIVYRAHDPVTQQTVGCQTIITIKQSSAQNSLPSFPDFKPAAIPAFRPASPLEFRPARIFNFDAQSQSKPFARLIDETPLSRRSESLIAERPTEHTVEGTSPSRNTESTRIDLGSSTSSYCPPSFEVLLKENQNLRSVVWEEPRFEGKLLKIYKSSFPGALFGQGDHDVKYEATTTDGITLRCNFQIHVRG